MNPVSYAFWWTLLKLKVWFPCETPNWVSKKQGNWYPRISAQPIHQGISVIREYYKGKTFVYRITYTQGDGNKISFNCEKRLKKP
jgi:hypothetical protein